MVKTDDYDNYVGNGNTIASAFGMKEEKEEEMLGEEEEDGAGHANWLPPRSKSAGLKYTEYESDESGRMMSNSKIMQSVDGGDVDDRRIRRQIANCNERRRMQSINAGFQQLRQLLPRKDGDKMSKASILAATAEFIQNLLSERNNLMEENAMSAAKRRRLDVGEKNGAPTMEEVPANIIECIKTIGQLRELLQKETQLRMEYEKELSELRVKARFGDASSFTSSGSDNFSPNSSTSSTENNNNRSLLIELKQQENQQHVFRPTPLPPLTDVNILSLSSAIASLAKSSPTAANGVQPPATASGLLTSPIGIHNHQQQQQFASNDGLSQPNGCSLFVGQPQLPNNHHQQQPIAIQPSGQQQAELNPATISQRNLQALVLAIRHLEGNTSGSNGANLIVR